MKTAYLINLTKNINIFTMNMCKNDVLSFLYSIEDNAKIIIVALVIIIISIFSNICVSIVVTRQKLNIKHWLIPYRQRD